MFLHYLKTIFREIRQNPLRFLLTSLGIAVGLVIFSFAYFLLFQTKGKDVSVFKYHERIVHFSAHDAANDKDYPLSADDWQKIQQMPLPQTEAMAIIAGVHNVDYVNVVRQPEKFMPFTTSWIRVANQEFFDVFSARFLKGSNQVWDKNSAIISQSFAKKVFGNENPLDNVIELTDETHHVFGSYRVVGVIKDIRVDAMGGEIYVSDYDAASSPFVFALLKKNADLDALNHQLTTIQRVDEAKNEIISPKAKFISQKRPLFRKEDGFAIGVLLLSLLVLFSALINFFNLLTHSVSSRIRQFTMRKIAGAGQTAIFLQLMFEILPFLLLSLLLSFGFTEILLTKLSLISEIIHIPINFYPAEVFYVQLKTMGIVLVLSILIMGVFMRKINKTLATEGIRGGSVSKTNRYLFRNISLGVQLLFAFFLLSSTFILFKFYNRMASEERILMTKTDAARIFAVPLLDFTLPEYQAEIIEKIKTLKGVDEVAKMGSFMMPGEAMDNDMQSYFALQTEYVLPDSIHTPFTLIAAEPDFFSVFNIDTRGLNVGSLAPDEALVSRAFMDKLKDFPHTESIDLGGGIFRIAGVVDNMPFTPAMQGSVWIAPPIPDVVSGVWVKSNKGNETDIRKALLSIIREYLPESIAYKVETFSEQQERRNGYSSVFYFVIYFVSFFSLIIALFGIYTAVTVDTQKKQKNVAIRKINGAMKIDIYLLFGKIYIFLMIASFTFSSALVVWIFGKQFDNVSVVYRPKIYPMLLLTLCVVAFFVLITMFWKLNKIANTHPADVVKSD